MNKTRFLLLQGIVLTSFFLVGKIIFSIYHSDIEPFTTSEILNIMWNGLRMDINTTAWLLIVPLCLTTLNYWRKLPLKSILRPYYILMAALVAIAVTADIVMYEFWKFKLSAVVLSYAASPEGASSSVSTLFIITRVGSGILAATILAWICIRTTPARLTATSRKRLIGTWMIFATCLWPTPTQQAYKTDSITKNHAAVNTVHNFFTSIRVRDYDSWYHYMDEDECSRIFSGLYPTDTDDIADTLLNTKRPNILFIQWESLGSQFVEEMGGLKNVTPHVSQLIQEGIFWKQYYSNSFRTDRGTVSTYSGYLSYPDVGLMREAKFHPHINSLARTLNEAGYTTTYLYPGAMTNMGKGTYLADMDFKSLLDNNYFTEDELDSPWGAHDMNSAKKTLGWIKQHSEDQHPWFMVYQTVSSHEPFDVPYNRLEDKVQNAFAYTDECIGMLVDSLKKDPVWDNLLVILIPDHGFLYQQTLQDPDFFHSPMVWTGGAICKAKVINTIMNQSDIAATLLSQLGISHRDYPWSRNVLSHNYTYPFAYSNYPAGFLFVDETGRTMYDLTANKANSNEGNQAEERIKKGKAILQISHERLQEIHLKIEAGR